RNFEAAMTLFEKSKKIYEELNYKGKVIFIEKQIAQLKRAMEYEKQKGICKEPIIQKSGETKKIYKKEGLNKEEILSEAEERRNKLRLQTLENEKKLESEKISNAKILEREKQKKQEIKESKVKLEEKQDQLKKQAELKELGEWTLEKAKVAVKNKNFDEAKIRYKESIDIFKELGWFDQVSVLYDEIKNIEKYKVEDIKKRDLDSQKRKKEEEEFQKRVNKIILEKKIEEEKKIDQLKELTPEIKYIMEKAKAVQQKAEKEEEVNLNRAIDRYQYITELYKSIPKDKLDLTTDISQIEEKIANLKSKI
ncbi:MAG TPA: hypothetical protein VGB37_11800, partial [Candidatus Lokiarchaeia archaeon]